jgi:hypothetical protein
VQYLGAEVRQLHRLFVGHLRQDERRRHDRGSALSTPSTSVQISIFDAPTRRRRLPRCNRIRSCRSSSSGRLRCAPMKPVTTGTAVPNAPERREVLAGRAIGLRKDYIGAGELLVRGQELTCVNESRAAEPVHVRRHDLRRQPLAEAGRHVQGAGRTVAEQPNAMQRVSQLGELRFDESADPPSALCAEKIVDRGTMARGRSSRMPARLLFARVLGDAELVEVGLRPRRPLRRSASASAR